MILLDDSYQTAGMEFLHVLTALVLGMQKLRACKKHPGGVSMGSAESDQEFVHISSKDGINTLAMEIPNVGVIVLTRMGENPRHSTVFVSHAQVVKEGNKYRIVGKSHKS